MTDIIQTQLIRIKLAQFETNILEFICKRSNSLWNQGVYYIKQWHKLTHPGNFPNVPYEQLTANLKDESSYKLLCAQAAQQTLKSVVEGYKGYAELLPMWRRGELVGNEPKQPSYRKKGGLFQVSYPAQSLTFYLDKPVVRIPLGNELAQLEGVQELFLPCPGGIKPEQIRELTIVPRNGQFYAAYTYKTQKPVVVELDQSKALGIDHGRDNWLTCVSNIGTSFIVDGKHLKSLNQWYNKQVANIKQDKPHRPWRLPLGEGFWNNRLAAITEKRNRQMRDAVNKSARLVIDYCLENKIGTIVFGLNPGQKQNSSMGRRGNQSFVQIPTAQLKERIKQMSKLYGIQFIETEEAYTSKSSFLDGDELPFALGVAPWAKHGEKPVGYKPSGKRVKRGLYRTGEQNWYINADANGSANILRKVSTMLGLDLSGVCRSALTAPIRLRLWHVASQQPLCKTTV